LTELAGRARTYVPGRGRDGLYYGELHNVCTKGIRMDETGRVIGTGHVALMGEKVMSTQICGVFAQNKNCGGRETVVAR
jgi:hypothetical protein